MIYKRKHLLEVRIRKDGTINGDDLFNETREVIREQCGILYNKLFDFNDTMNQLDARLFDEKLKHQTWKLQKTLSELFN